VENSFSQVSEGSTNQSGSFALLEKAKAAHPVWTIFGEPGEVMRESAGSTPAISSAVRDGFDELVESSS
jgi:hypothetical protein